MDTDQKQINTNIGLLYPELSYEIQGCIYVVANKYGKGLKEVIYENALMEEFEKRKIKAEKQKVINIYSEETGKILGTYRPDILVEELVVMEIKSSNFTAIADIKQQYSYLKGSKYELAYLVNFSTPRLYIKRSIYTNNRKPHLNRISVN